MKSKNEKLLAEFWDYCKNHPDERFWQALRNWAGVNFVSVSDDLINYTDTFYWTERNK